MPKPSRGKRLLHRIHFAAQRDGGADGQRLTLVGDDLADIAGDAAQIALVDIRVDIERRLNVVVVDDDRRLVAPERGQVAKQLRRVAVGRGDRRPRKLRQRADALDRRLRNNLVVDAVQRIQPLVRRRLAAARQRDQGRVGDVLLRQPNLPRLHAIDVHLHGGVRNLLVDVHVDRSRNGEDALQNLLRQLVVSLAAAGHGDVDRRRQAKIQNLVGDVRGHEEEGAVRKLLRQILAQPAHVLFRMPLAGVQRDQNLPVGVRDGGVRTEGKVDAAIRKSNVVEDQLDLIGRNHPADLGFNRGKVLLGVFNAQALGRIHMQRHLPESTYGKKSSPMNSATGSESRTKTPNRISVRAELSRHQLSTSL